MLHQLELHQREISGDSYPYGLQLILQALGCATHYSDPIAVLNLDPVIARLREQIDDPDYIRQLAQRLLLDNPHRVTLVMTPDPNCLTRQQEERGATPGGDQGSHGRRATATGGHLAADLLNEAKPGRRREHLAQGGAE